MNVDLFITPNTLHNQFGQSSIVDSDIISLCQQNLKTEGWALLRGFDTDLQKFSDVVKSFCTNLTFDPAREYGNQHTQKVNSGTDAIGLHIENGNTPLPPDIIGFYSKRAALTGSQTTICDGIDIYENLSPALQQQFEQNITVSRRLPEQMWKTYVANEHPAVNQVNDVTTDHLFELLAAIPNQRGTLNTDMTLEYALDLAPIKWNVHHQKPAFANALLGPSFNYEKPRYHFSDGTELTAAFLAELAEIAEQSTHEIPWQDNDIVLIDNTRMMHGRRRITDSSRRELYIGMGRL